MAADEVPAPGLREVAQVWWDHDVVPVVRWRRGGRLHVLVDPARPDNEIVLARFDPAPADPVAVARVLAEGLAACDFPPTDDGASVPRVAATLAAAGRWERPRER